MRFRTFFGIMLIFALGIIAGVLLSSKSAEANANTNNTWQDTPVNQLLPYNPFSTVEAKESPKDRIPEKAIEVYKDRIILDISNAQWSSFTDTHSMEPVIFKGANAIEITPTSEDDIKVGDIVSYKSDYADGTIIHRVVYKGQDEKGTYFVMKGDNLPASDPGRVRFSQMQRVVVGLIY